MCHNKSVSPRRGGVTASLCVLTFRGTHHPPRPISQPWPFLLPSHLCSSDKSWVGQWAYSVISAHRCVSFSNGRSFRIALTSPSLFYPPVWLSSVLNTHLNCGNTNLCACAKFKLHLPNLYFIWPFTIAMEIRKDWLEGWPQLGRWESWVFLSPFNLGPLPLSCGFSTWFFQVCFPAGSKTFYMAI